MGFQDLLGAAGANFLLELVLLLREVDLREELAPKWISLLISEIIRVETHIAVETRGESQAEEVRLILTLLEIEQVVALWRQVSEGHQI